MHLSERAGCRPSAVAGPATAVRSGKITTGRMSGWNSEWVLAEICSTWYLDLATWLSGLGCGWQRPGKGRRGARPNWRAVSASNEKSRDCILEDGLKHELLLDRRRGFIHSYLHVMRGRDG